MKSLFTTLSGVALSLTIACGSFDKTTQSGPPGPAQAPTVTKSGETGTPSNFGSLLVDSSSELAPCTLERKGALAYVKNEGKFYVCSGEWSSVSIKGDKGDPGTPTTSGLNISQIQKVKADPTNYCTQFSTIERCRFLGGQLIRFSDGGILVSVNWEYSAYSSISHDSAFDLACQTFLIPSTSAGLWAKLHPMVARGAGYKDVFLFFNRERDRFSIIYDRNDSGDVDSNDEVLAVVSVENF